MSSRLAGITVALAGLVLCSYLIFELDLPGMKEGIPITGQTLAVCTFSVILKRSSGLIVVGLYLMLGAIGLPVFADGASGLEHLLGRTSGYLWSFLLVPFIIGRGKGIKWHSGWIRPFIANLIGTAVILSIGTLVLGMHIGPEKAVTYGFKPFIPGGIIKSLIGTFLIRLYYFMKHCFRL